MRKLTKLEQTKVQYAAWWLQIPMALLAWWLTDAEFLLMYNLGISIWTGIVTAKADRDVVKEDSSK